MKLSNKVYNLLKWVTTIALPAVGALYFVLAQTWGFEHVMGVNATINAIVVFLGTMLGLSTRQYNKTVNAPDGDLIVQEVDGEKYLGLGVNRSIDELTGKNTVRLNVVERPRVE